ncbi:MAG: DNA double-strand break repair nuclease NurA [Actinomycetota bacterium]
MLKLRADPWMPDYGMGFQAALEEPPHRADPFVETSDWSRPVSPSGPGPAAVWFVDGVRRVDVRLIAEAPDGSRRVPGLFGSYAVGAVRCDGSAEFASHAVARAVVTVGGLVPERVEVPCGAHRLGFESATDPKDDPDRPLLRLQDLMREREAALAAEVAGAGTELVLVDGPLSLRDETKAPVVGMVKRFARRYLEAEQERLLSILEAGERTPVFGLELPGQAVERYAWYLRLVPLRPPWHDHAGIVRCEVPAGIGVDRAVRLADLVTTVLPRFAGRPTDPRAPQNLAPVGGLETWLRHRMGHPGIVRRAVLEWLSKEAA